MNFREAYHHTISSIEPVYDKDEAKAIAKLLFSEQYNASSLVSNSEDAFLFEDELEAIIERLQRHEPLQHILGHAWFCGLRIAVNKHVLIPRPETEELVSLVKPYLAGYTGALADICTGSGCIALAIHALTGNNKIIATDISIDALETASANELMNFNQKNILFRQHDILGMQWPFDIPGIVICNPPYIEKREAAAMDEHVLAFEPHLALFVEGNDPLLFYKAVIQTFLPYAFPNIFFEINPLSGNALRDYCAQFLLDCQISHDMQGRERFAIVSKS